MILLPLQTVVLALIFGVVSLILARRLKIPAILFYLLSGILAGPAGFHLLQDESLGNGLVTLVEIGVAIILFEGGLSLSSSGFRQESNLINRILLISIPLTGAGGAFLARYLLGLSWEVAFFFGALIVVTGPTVITSILKTLSLKRRVETLLHWESLWGDVVGVLLSAVVLEWLVIPHRGDFRELGFHFLFRLGSGVAIGFLSGYLLARIVLPFTVRLRDPGLPGITTVAWALATFYLANILMEASGPLAAAVAGFLASHFRSEGLHEVRHFKEQLTSLFIGTLFVLLSAFINPLALMHSWSSILTLALLLGAVVRPLSIFLALAGTGIPWQEKAYIGFIGPRGIIALATAAYAALLVKEKPAELILLLNSTFAVIFLSGAIATLISHPLAVLLKIRIPRTHLGLLIVGLNPLGTGLAAFAKKYIPVSFADTRQETCTLADNLGYETVCADVLDSDFYEDALAQGFGRLLVVTRNDALNQLIVQAAAAQMGPDQVFYAQALPDREPVMTKPTLSTPLAFGENFDVGTAVKALQAETARLEIRRGDDSRQEGVIPLLELVGDGGLCIVTETRPIKGEALCYVPNA